MKYIFKIKIKKGRTVEEYIKAWRRGSNIIQKFPGARGTRLYRNLGSPNNLIAIADWESKKARDAALEGVEGIKKLGPKDYKIVHAHRKYGKFIPIGAFEEIAKVVKK